MRSSSPLPPCAVVTYAVCLCGLAAADTSAPLQSQPPSGWCIVVGSAPYGDFARADALAERARRAGAESVAVYDPRDFLNLGLGELVVVETGVGDAHQAQARVALLKKARLDAHAKRCQPRPGAGPIADARAVRPPDALGDRPVDPAAIRPGCFAWSPITRVLACVLGHGNTMNDGEDTLAVTLLGGGAAQAPVPLPHFHDDTLINTEANIWGARSRIFDPTPSERAKLRAMLAGFVHLDGLRGRLLERGGQVRWLQPRFGGRWRNSSGLELRCGGEWISLGMVSEGSHNDTDRSVVERVFLAVIPGTRYVIAESTRGRGTEGEYGFDLSAKLFDLDTCRER